VLAELRPRCGPSYRPDREVPSVVEVAEVRDALDYVPLCAGVEFADLAAIGEREGRSDTPIVRLERGDVLIPSDQRRFFDQPGLLTRGCKWLPDAGVGIMRCGFDASAPIPATPPAGERTTGDGKPSLS
jgi:hypothetical protein